MFFQTERLWKSALAISCVKIQAMLLADAHDSKDIVTTSVDQWAM